MIAASTPLQRPARSRLLHVDAEGHITHGLRSRLIDVIRPGDVMVANDAATLPASLRATHLRSNAEIEIRLAARYSLDNADMRQFAVIVFGAGDHRTRTEHRAAPPDIRVGDRMRFDALTAVVREILDHPRFMRIEFDADASQVWALLAREGRPIQYAHMPQALALWDVWTPIAALPFAFEPPSAGFALDWQFVADVRAKTATFVTLTHAAGISSTGDDMLDRRLPLDEPYTIPVETAEAINAARREQRRVIAIGTTVTRALEHSARNDGIVRHGASVATQRLGPASRLLVVDAILSGTHEAGTSHYDLLRAFIADDVLDTVNGELEAQGYLTHEFGDSILIEADARRVQRIDAVREQQLLATGVAVETRNAARQLSPFR